jgi:hypothetical protein
MAPPPAHYPPKNQQNRAAGLNSSTPAFRPTPLPKPLYYPTIFRYKCRGGFFATSDEPYSNGVCRGIQTQLQHVRDLHKSTEDESVRIFLQDYVPPRQDTSQQGASSQHNEILSIPAMIYEDPKKKEVMKKANALLLLKNAPKEEEEEWHDWACYGTTEVRLLVLRDAKTNEEKTAAVAPDCRLGLSVRDVGNEQGGDTVATVRMGPVEVLLRNQYELHEEKPSKHLQQQQRKHLENTLKGIEESEPSDKKDKKRNQITHSNNKGSDEESMPANPSNRSIGATTFINGGQKVFDSSKKVVAAMQTNANILYEAVREDFPQRTWGASQRVVGQFGKTIERTSSLMNQLYDIWNEDDDED